MKKSVLLSIGVVIAMAGCRGSSSTTTVTVTTSDNKMKIEVRDYNEIPPIEFSKDYDITGMDSAQQKELSQKVLDSVGHGKYK